MPTGTYRSNIPATDIEFCKFILRRMFGYNINLRIWRARKTRSSVRRPRPTYSIRAAIERTTFAICTRPASFRPRISAARGASVYITMILRKPPHEKSFIINVVMIKSVNVIQRHKWYMVVARCEVKFPKSPVHAENTITVIELMPFDSATWRRCTTRVSLHAARTSLNGQ